MINFRKKAVVMLLTTVFTAGMLSGCGTSGDTEKSKNDSRKAVEQTTQAEVDTDRKSQNEEDESESRDIFAMDSIGSTVKFYDEEFDEELEYRIVGSTESDILKGLISNESPLGKGLIGAKIGETVQVESPDGFSRYKILGISRE